MRRSGRKRSGRKSRRSGRKRSGRKRKSRRFGHIEEKKKWPKVEPVTAHRTGQAPVKIPGLVKPPMKSKPPSPVSSPVSSASSQVSLPVSPLPSRIILKVSDIKTDRCCEINKDFKKLIEQFRKFEIIQSPKMIKFIQSLYIFIVKYLSSLIFTEKGSIFNVLWYDDPLKKEISKIVMCDDEIGVDPDSQCIVKCLELLILQIRKFDKQVNGDLLKQQMYYQINVTKEEERTNFLIDFYNTQWPLEKGLTNFESYIYTDYSEGGLWYVITNSPCILKI